MLYFLFAGNGGSTLVSISYLYNLYGEELYNQRVLLIHAGGQSQRLPSASVLGKAFSPMPFGNPIHQVLDIKLAMYCPLIPKMGPGIFVTCADVLLVYNLGDDWDMNDDFQFSQTGFTALAHPSPIKVGTTHGVYVLRDVDKTDSNAPALMCECLEVLQKPSEEVMHEKGAVLKSDNLCFCDEIDIVGSVAYTDSSFFFTHDITRKMKTFTDNQGQLNCEIDAYGDFLQALGPKAAPKYIHNTSNVSTVTPNLLETRQKVFDLLKGTDITILIMNASRFYHIGTTKEYIYNFCQDQSFQEGMGLSMNAFNLWTESENDILENDYKNGKDSNDPSHTATDIITEPDSALNTCQGCVMQSILPKSSTISNNSVVEYSKFDVPVDVGVNAIISNCEFSKPDKQMELKIWQRNNKGVTNEKLKIPANTFLHTIPIRQDNETKYVTVCFGISDNLKKAVSENDFQCLPYLGRTVKDYCKVFEIELNAVSKGYTQSGSKYNLWFTDLFPVADSMTESLTLTLAMADALQNGVNGLCLASYKLLSIATALKSKDVHAMLQHRNRLFKKIRAWVPE